MEKYALYSKPKDETDLDDTLKQWHGEVRETIPLPRPKAGSGFWAALKSAIGKDITHVSMPVHFNEPISFLQRLTEDLASSDVLDNAAKQTDSLKRLAYVAAFSCSMYASSGTGFRNYKPFNPLLGETYECVRPDLGFRCICEQVSHHPPISAMHAESASGWVVKQEYQGVVKFRNVMRVIPHGIASVEFPEDNERYTFTKQTLVVHNIMFGRMWVDHEGTVTITNHRTGETCDMVWSPYSSVGKRYFNLHGYVKDAEGRVQYTINGRWDEGLVLIPGEVQWAHLRDSTQLKDDSFERLWTAPPIPPDCKEKYGMTTFSMSLNNKEDNVCPTDSRLRPDQRLLEDGDMQTASDTKRALEEKQRAARKAREAEKEQHTPRWFQLVEDPETDRTWFTYKGSYWDDKAQGKFANKADYPDIYV
ncbi:hypothetical protein PTSG_09883 [Salpingoeca rosetta]|uniref:Oxysterol-binding protein n=1 Tax=Salpingoeca rosetta (strain ATCC 50818 / BSB-021) TaxID=946362 RepID=F2UNE7_SALR5|nr:uncharacterized protein PTSG_09883 [Salpingoeca rosetta]EGD79152.1 hypothetical protein PTSG_09883 [Salpingoeca rosetta]|eukprot:XP_004989237.1 hypothetical protein PTSG_09883 [Salpingoeca rosetta]